LKVSDGRILAADLDGAYALKLLGDVRVSLCTTIDDYFNNMLGDPEFVSVLVDLCEAEGVDSTTLGLLARLALRVYEKHGFRPVIYSCNPGINRLLQSMAFQRIFEIREEACSNPESIRELPAVNGGEEDVKKRVIEAHRTLMDLSDDNRKRFKDLMIVLEA
jgi:anti-anti-sigma regulatory factor